MIYQKPACSFLGLSSTWMILAKRIWLFYLFLLFSNDGMNFFQNFWKAFCGFGTSLDNNVYLKQSDLKEDYLHPLCCVVASWKIYIKLCCNLPGQIAPLFSGRKSGNLGASFQISVLPSIWLWGGLMLLGGEKSVFHQNCI